jgi:hypothetical protein
MLITRGSTGELADIVKAELSEENHPLSLEEFPTLHDIYPRLGRETAADPFEPIAMPPRETFLDEVMVYIHSSGSTVRSLSLSCDDDSKIASPVPGIPQANSVEHQVHPTSPLDGLDYRTPGHGD